MKATIHQPSKATALAAALRSRSRLLISLATALLALIACGLLSGQAAAAGDAMHGGLPADLRVGHTVKQITVAGSLPGENRAVDVHLWYPADQRGLSDRPKTVYTSGLHGRALPLTPWTPLAWQVEAEIAREAAPIDPDGPAFPVIVFSHGSNNDPIDYAHTLELIAGAGFVVAAPYHVNNTQDDARIDYVNQQAREQLHATQRVLYCNDGLPPRANFGTGDCSKSSVPLNMADRLRDISRILDELPRWFGNRVDVSRAGVMGHSRGTVTALAAAGGSNAWGFGPLMDGKGKPRVKAVMGMAIGAAAITNSVDLAAVTVPTVLVAGGRDQNPSVPPALKVSEDAFATISSADKLLVEIPNATHRSFDSTYCAQLQSAAAQAKIDPKALLDAHTVGLIAASAPGFMSGKAVHYCAPRFFTSPVNIQHVVASTRNAEYFCSDTEDPNLGNQLDRFCGLAAPVEGPASPCVSTSIPCTGLDTDEVKQGITDIAVAFFQSALRRTDGDGIDFKRYLAPKWLIDHVPMVGSAQAYAGPGSICPPGQGVICAHH